MASNALSLAFCAPRAAVRVLLLALVVPAGGCSADVTRFDFPAFGIADSSTTRPTGALPTPSEPVWQRAPAYTPNYAPTYNESLAAPRGAGLSDAPPAIGGASGDRVDRTRGQVPSEARAFPPKSDAGAGRAMERRAERPRVAASGQMVEVQHGDTLHGIARQHGVSIGALIELNGLGDGATLKPGQRLALPASATSQLRATDARRERLPSRPPAPVPGWEGQHTLKAGESLYAVAHQYRVAVPELLRVNGIVEPTKVRAGTVLSVPHGSQAAAPTAAPGAAGPPVQARIINQSGEVRTAALADRAVDASPPLPAPVGSPPVGSEAGGKFRWPARGRVIAAFGARSDGTHNDGINIAVPLGTEIHAAESGHVAYAGSELKGYGNLVLIRHDGGWVSAYAHADQLLVKRDDVVRRGQVIGRAGRTGSVDQPQLHFELRQGAKPIDPLPHMER